MMFSSQRVTPAPLPALSVSSVGEQQGWRKLFTLVRRVVALTLLFWFTLMPAAWAVDKIGQVDPKLEAQILQVLRQHPDTILEAVQKYQIEQRQKQLQLQKQALEQVKANPAAFVAQSPVFGSPDQKIVLMEFADFQCPYCAKVRTVLKQFISNHANEVTLVYKHYPLLDSHPKAIDAARASWAAAMQGKFWPYYDALFSHQSELGEDLYLETAKKLNLDLEQFNSDRLLADEAIRADMNLAVKLGIAGTPFFVMNGEVLFGAIELADLEKALAQVKKSLSLDPAKA